MTDTMKAIRIHEFGGPEVLQLEKINRPIPKEGEILVRNKGAGVNPVDWKIRDGVMRTQLEPLLPLTLGGDFAGIVEAAPGVAGFTGGDAVYGLLGVLGAYAEYLIAKPNQIAPKPKSLDFPQAAAVPLAGLTAWQALFDVGHLEAGQTVLIHAAVGGVGSFAVQFARYKGAKVIATTSAANADYVHSLGAETVIDYRLQPFEGAVSGVDLVIDFVGGETQQRSLGVVREGGALVTAVGMFGEAIAAAAQMRNVRLGRVSAQANSAQLQEIGALIDAGHVTVSFAGVFSLEQVAEAHRFSATGRTRGKLALKIGD